MWIAGLVGMATKFFTCTLSCMYRKKDSAGIVQGGPMYWIEVALGPRWRFLGVLFSLFGMIGCLALFQINQLASLLHTDYAIPRAATGAGATFVVGIVILGGIARVGRVTARIVPFMAVLYFVSSLVIVSQHLDALGAVLQSIFVGAFHGGSVAGGVAGVTVREALITGVRRAAFSNEAGIGTAPMAHGAARTDEPVREGLVAMLGPFIDTNIVCTLTALVILTSGVTGTDDGVLLTAAAFEAGMPGGRLVLTLVILLFSLSTLISYSYYSSKCAKYVLGDGLGGRYVYVYLGTVFLGALWSQDMVVNMLDTAFAMMAIPTLTSTLALSPRVVAATRDYFARMEASG
jgi:AGCS family alanine or glycine:cation symporter